MQTIVALIRNGCCETTIFADPAIAATWGYDLILSVTGDMRRPNGWQIGATFYPDKDFAEQTNAQAMEKTATDALVNLRAYVALGSPTNAQTIAVVRLLCRCVIALIRFKLSKLDGAD